MANYDSVYVTNLPSFYKINLFNKIAEKKKIAVIFTGDDPQGRNDDFFFGKCHFDLINLNPNHLFHNISETFLFFQRNCCSEIVLGGWDAIIYWLLLLFLPNKKSFIVESSYKESSTSGIKGLLKKIFLSRVSKVYVPGKSNRRLLEKLNFDGEIIETKGVGIFNIVTQPVYIQKDKVCNFLYVGRLSPEKNLAFLIQTFNDLPQYTLNIVGFGPDEVSLKSIANSNIHFHGAVENKRLSLIYQENDVFILPSLSEPWGLVVEEALNNGLPVIVSDNVGCAEELVNSNNGIIFPLDEVDSLKKSIYSMTNIDFYNQLRKSIAEYDFNIVAENQVKCYV